MLSCLGVILLFSWLVAHAGVLPGFPAHLLLMHGAKLCAKSSVLTWCSLQGVHVTHDTAWERRDVLGIHPQKQVPLPPAVTFSHDVISVPGCASQTRQ